MIRFRYLLFAILPLFTLGFLATVFLRTDQPVRVQKLVAQAEPMLPLPISTVVQPVQQPAPEQAAAPAPAPKPAPKVASKPKASSPAPRIQSTRTATPAPASKPVASCSGSFASEFICLLNNYRISKGLKPVYYSSAISVAALAHSTWMNTTGTFSHTGINGSRMNTRCATAGTVCRAENLAKGAVSPQNLLDMWKASGSHNANLLGPYTQIGIGISGSYITADFN